MARVRRVPALFGVVVTAAVSVKHVQERTGEQQQERQDLDYVSPVFRQYEVRADQGEAKKDPNLGPAAAGGSLTVVAVYMISHVSA